MPTSLNTSRSRTKTVKEKFIRTIKRDGFAWRNPGFYSTLRSHPEVLGMGIVCVVLMIIFSASTFTIKTLDHNPAQDDSVEQYYDPAVVLKEAKIPPATSPKNFQLKDFNPCTNFRHELIESGFNLRLLDTEIKQPMQQVMQLHDRVAGNPPDVYVTYNNSCFWMMNVQDSGTFDYITFQVDHYSKQPTSSERRQLLVMINGPDNPPKPGHDAIYSASRYEIKGYTAFIISEYDTQVQKRLCSLNFWPYLAMGATGSDCDKVKKLATLILP